MNEEEKQAIEKLKSIVKVNKDFLKGVENQTINQEEIKSIEIALNMIESLLWKEGKQKELLKYKTDVIDKQQKEIEELKEYKHDAELTKVACCTAQNCEALNNCIKLERKLQNADKKWEDKIKAKIEERNQWLQEYDEQEEMNELQKDDYRLIKVERNILQSLLEKE